MILIMADTFYAHNKAVAAVKKEYPDANIMPTTFDYNSPPHAHSVETDYSLACLSYYITAMRQADLIYFAGNWTQDFICQHIHSLAQDLHIPIVYQEKERWA